MNKFDKIAQECQALPFEEGWKKIWTEMFSLKTIFVPIKKTEEVTKEPFVFAGTLNEEPCVFFFTDLTHFEDFKKDIEMQENHPVLDYKELTVTEFVNFCEHLSQQNAKYVVINYPSKYGFHTESHTVGSMYNAFLNGEHLHEHHVPEGTNVQVSIPHDVEEMKEALEKIKGNYRTVLNSVCPILVKVTERIDLTFVMDFKGGLPDSMKKKVMENIHKELSVYPIFQRQLYFTEEQRIVPSNIRPILQVNFQS